MSASATEGALPTGIASHHEHGRRQHGGSQAQEQQQQQVQQHEARQQQGEQEQHQDSPLDDRVTGLMASSSTASMQGIGIKRSSKFANHLGVKRLNRKPSSLSEGGPQPPIARSSGASSRLGAEYGSGVELPSADTAASSIMSRSMWADEGAEPLGEEGGIIEGSASSRVSRATPSMEGPGSVFASSAGSTSAAATARHASPQVRWRSTADQLEGHAHHVAPHEASDATGSAFAESAEGIVIEEGGCGGSGKPRLYSAASDGSMFLPGSSFNDNQSGSFSPMIRQRTDSGFG